MSKSYSSESYGSKEPLTSLESFSNRHRRKNYFRDNSHGEFWKAKPPMFDGEVKFGQAKAWILGIRKYFQVHDYSRNTKDRFAIFNLNGRTSIWWEHLNKVKKINERKVVWK